MVFHPFPEDKKADKELMDPDSCRMQEDAMIMTIFTARLDTLPFLAWEKKDGVLVKDVRQAASHLKSTMLRCTARRMRGMVTAWRSEA